MYLEGDYWEMQREIRWGIADGLTPQEAFDAGLLTDDEAAALGLPPVDNREADTVTEEPEGDG